MRKYRGLRIVLRSAFLGDVGGRICWPTGQQPPDSPKKNVEEAQLLLGVLLVGPIRTALRGVGEPRPPGPSDSEWSRRWGDWMGRRGEGDSFSLTRSVDGYAAEKRTATVGCTHSVSRCRMRREKAPDVDADLALSVAVGALPAAAAADGDDDDDDVTAPVISSSDGLSDSLGASISVDMIHICPGE